MKRVKYIKITFHRQVQSKMCENSIVDCSPPCRLKVEWSFVAHHTFVELHRELQLNNWRRQGFKMYTKQTQNGSIQLAVPNPILQKPTEPKLIWKDVINTFFLSVIFTVVTKLKELACTMPDVDTGAQPWVEAVNKVFSNLLGISGLLGDLDYVRRAVRAHARNVLWTTKLPVIFNLLEGEEIMIFIFGWAHPLMC